MAQLGGNFDANSVTPKSDFDIIPPGPEPMMIVASEMRPTKDTEAAGIPQFIGQAVNPDWQGYLWLELDVIDGPNRGRKLWDRLNLVNKNPKAVEIAERTLSAICHAVGVLNVQDSEQLHGRPMIGKVKVKPAAGAFPAANEIGTYEPMPIGGPAPRPAAPATAPATPAYTPAAPAIAAAASRPAAGATPPWRK